jgi:hypothetical protein
MKTSHEDRPHWDVCPAHYLDEALDQIDHLQEVNAVLLTALLECEEFLDDQADVIDGDYGQPKANRAMMLMMEVTNAIRKAGRP